MKNLINKIQDLFSQLKIKKQLRFIYITAIVIPVFVIGTFLILTASKLLNNYHKDLLESDNLRVKTILFEITAQIYNISEEISFDKSLQTILSSDYRDEADFIEDLNTYETTQNYLYTYTELDDILIYTDNPSISQTGQLYLATEEIQNTDWYQKAAKQSSVFWVPFNETDQYGNEYWSLTLVRKVPIVDSPYNAVLVIKLSDNYLKNRINNNNYGTSISLDDVCVIYSSNREEYGLKSTFPINYDADYFQLQDEVSIDGNRYLSNITTLNMYQSDSKLYICSYNEEANNEINRIIFVCAMIILLAILLPGLLIYYFTTYFVKRVDTLRGEMHRASNDDYNIVGNIYGHDELSEAFEDLKLMVQKIEEKDAKMYEARLNEQKLHNEQQVMEFKMLSSQINPHFLYNTLETIRMKAFTAGNKEVATAIKLLGKSMRYVLDNTGIASTTLKKELDYIDSYLQIQKLRFNERVNYTLILDKNIDPQNCMILPLLLQPIVENAIVHGLEEMEGNGHIEVHIYEENNQLLHIDISDNGCGMTEDELRATVDKIESYDKSRSFNIGIYNTNQRIKLCYGKEYGITIDSVLGKGTTVKILFPIQHNSGDENL
jgi:two-component system sensor histidine kinase YesM